jgi:hypothetical protein
MSTNQVTSLLQQAARRLQRLSPERLRVADDFLAYLEEREQLEATQEMLDIPGFDTALQVASQEAKVGKVVRFEDVRRDV